MNVSEDHLNESIARYIRTDFTKLNQRITVTEALGLIRKLRLGEKIIYFYVVDDDDRLVGVVPTRRLLMAELNQKLSDFMVSRVVTISQTAKLLDILESFILHRFLAFPVVDDQRRIVGVIDVSVFTDQMLDLAENPPVDDIFEVIGFQVSEIRNASPFKAFRYRFPWLLVTITSGTICAMLAGLFEATLAQSLVLAFFLTMILGLGESVSIQSMSIAIQTLRVTSPSWLWYRRALKKEMVTAGLLGSLCAVLVTLIAWLWRGAFLQAAVIGMSILTVLVFACLMGLTIPTLLHLYKLDLKITAGPVTLALTDIFTLTFYFSLARVMLQ
jgi:magnesium transporter